MELGELDYNKIDVFYIEGNYSNLEGEYFSINMDPIDGYNEALDKNINNITIHVRYNDGTELRIK